MDDENETEDVQERNVRGWKDRLLFAVLLFGVAVTFAWSGAVIAATVQLLALIKF